MPIATLDDARLQASPKVAAALLGGGIAFDFTVHSHVPGIATAAFVIALAAALATVARNRTRRAALGVVALLAIFFTLRASPTLVALDLSAISILVALAADGGLRDLSSFTVTRTIESAFSMIGHVLAAPAYALRPFAPAFARARGVRAGRALRVAALVTPVLVLFAVLLAAADRVFANLITPSFAHVPLGSWIAHVVVAAAGVWIVATLWRAAVAPNLPGGSDAAAHDDSWNPPRTGRAWLGVTEWTALLVGIDVLFGVFVAVQLAVLFGGASRVEVTPGLTYAEYARSGFFQLLAVAVLTEIVIVGTWDLARRPTAAAERTFRALVGVMTALSFVILASATMRLRLYEEAFGFTINRLVATIAIAVIGAVMAASVTLILTRSRERLLAVVTACGLAGLLALNILNPDRFVAEHNVRRFHATGKADLVYLAHTLGADAVPVIVPLLGDVSGIDRSVVLNGLCDKRADLEPERRRDWNLGRSRARDALAAAGIDEPACRRIVGVFGS